MPNFSIQNEFRKIDDFLKQSFLFWAISNLKQLTLINFLQFKSMLDKYHWSGRPVESIQLLLAQNFYFSESSHRSGSIIEPLNWKLSSG